MTPLSKHVRKLLREAASEAYRRELDLELKLLHAVFEQWRRGEVSAFDVSDHVHRFHQGPNRELYLRYTGSDPLFPVAGAINTGIIRLDELHPDLLPTVEPLVKQIRSFSAGK